MNSRTNVLFFHITGSFIYETNQFFYIQLPVIYMLVINSRYLKLKNTKSVFIRGYLERVPIKFISFENFCVEFPFQLDM